MLVVDGSWAARNIQTVFAFIFTTYHPWFLESECWLIHGFAQIGHTIDVGWQRFWYLCIGQSEDGTPCTEQQLQCICELCNSPTM